MLRITYFLVQDKCVDILLNLTRTLLNTVRLLEIPSISEKGNEKLYELIGMEGVIVKMPIKYSHLIHKDWLEQIILHGKNLTPWEQDFIQSLRRTISLRLALTEFQEEKLEQIYANRAPL